MEYNTEKNIENIKRLLNLIKYDAESLLKELKVEATDDELACMWRACEMIEDYADRARVLIGKMSDEREDMRAEEEGE